jgi:hypothetical protein
MSNQALGLKQLMQDGKWTVPEDQRPAGWQRYEKTTITSLVQRTTETEQIEVMPDPPTAEPEIALVEPVLQPQDVVSVQAEPKTISFLPLNPDHLMSEIIENLLIVYAPNAWSGDASPDAELDRLSEVAEKLYHWRESKLLCDKALTGWVGAHKLRLSKLGINSEPIRDLWRAVQDLLMPQLIRISELEREVERLKHRIKKI